MRRVAEEGGFGINTVRSGYALLERDGLVHITERGGVVVRAAPSIPEPAYPADAEVCWDRHGRERLDQLLEQLVRSDPGFAIAAPGPDLLPTRRLARCFSSLAGNWIDYAETRGELELRRRIALHYEPVNGPTSPDHLLITNGATEAISLLVTTFVKPEDVVVVESPTYYDYFRQLANARATIVEIRTRTGRGLDALEELFTRRRVRMVIAQPNVQNPTGASMSDDDKRRLVSACARHGCILVQDDVYGDLAFGPRRAANLPLFGDFPGLILISSISKSLSPGLRIGWIRSTGLMAELTEAKVRSSLCSSRPAQLALAEFLASTAYPRHLQQIRAAVAQRLESYMALLSRECGCDRSLSPGRPLIPPRVVQLTRLGSIVREMAGEVAPAGGR
jgi:DNA-binding transcriptional MocR family regulator